ncbi:MAG: efflux RND transporter permease subunit [Bacteroidales bacterium]|nr:efflux RND transporter permease subunit [Bacteroidales bacterium]
MLPTRPNTGRCRKLPKTLKKEIEKQDGIRKVEIMAFPEREIRVSLDMEKMAQMNISPDQVAGAVQSNNANIPGGLVEMGNRVLPLKPVALIKTSKKLKIP